VSFQASLSSCGPLCKSEIIAKNNNKCKFDKLEILEWFSRSLCQLSSYLSLKTIVSHLDKAEGNTWLPSGFFMSPSRIFKNPMVQDFQLPLKNPGCPDHSGRFQATVGFTGSWVWEVWTVQQPSCWPPGRPQWFGSCACMYFVNASESRHKSSQLKYMW